MPLIVVDEQVIPGLVHCGIAPDDATDYAMVGCNEVGVPGVNWSVGISSGTYHDDMSLFMRAFASAPADADAEQVLQIWGSQLEDTLNGGIGRNHRWRTRMAAERPMPLTTALFRDGPRLAQDYVLLPGNEAVGTFTRGTANLVNALAALESLSHGPDAVDLGTLREASAQGDEPMLTRCLAAPKWGSDDPKVDQWMRRINELRLKICDSLAEKHRIPAVPVCHVVRSLHHVDGARIDASPDGRHAGESLADSIGAVCGTTDEGPTAILNSVLAVDPAAFKGVYNFNLSLVGAQGKPEVLGALIDAFIASGGQELQVAVLDPAKLREAQAHPEGFGDLVVRIAGLNARFVELSRREQDEVIKRAECA
jgi:formate C-acetyltransferase